MLLQHPYEQRQEFLTCILAEPIEAGRLVSLESTFWSRAMEGYRDLQLLTFALRDGLVNPGRVAEVVSEWDRPTDQGLITFLIERGVMTDDVYRQLKQLSNSRQLASTPRDQSVNSTSDLTSSVDGTVDHVKPGGTHRSFHSTDRYELIRLHQQGGLGQVWLARDSTVGREVALKKIRPERAFNPSIRARFLQEAQVTGRLEHPCIVPLYDLGEDNEPYYVMRFIAGRTLTEVAEDYHQRRIEGKVRTLDLNSLLDAFVAVCRAVHFAHSHGYLHRDLKGKNIIVGEYGEVFLLDWGLAKPIGESQETTAPTDSIEEESGEMTTPGIAVGTPAYMAPEVAQGRAAILASDIYGLGAILYSVLAGRPPYVGKNTSDILKQVTTTDPVPITAANTAANPALVAVCEKAMARNPSDRYSSADELATEIRNWLADAPVMAYREPWMARLARWARRRKTTVVAAAVLLATTAIATTVTAVWVWKEKQRTEFERQRAEKEKENAEENEKNALTVADDLSEYVRKTETTVSGPVKDADRKKIINQVLANYERLLAMNPDNANVRSNVARMYRYRANLSRLLYDTTDAEKSYREASGHYKALANSDPTNIYYREEIAQTARDFGLFLQNLGHLKDASVILEDSVHFYDELHKSSPDKEGYARMLANVLVDRSYLDHELGKYHESEVSARRSAGLYGSLAGFPQSKPDPLDPLFHGMAEIRLAVALRELGRLDESLPVHNRAVDRLDTIAKVNKSRDYLHFYYRARDERATTLSRSPARSKEALADIEAAIQGWKDLVKQYPLIPVYLRYQGWGTLHRGQLQVLLGRRDLAAQDFEAATKIFDGLSGKFVDVPIYRSYLGQTHLAMGKIAEDPKQAALSFTKARTMLEAVLKQNPDRFEDREVLAELKKLSGAKP
jgi:serine/threonine protein kinase/tetratricopeptide (TPR) repeat protein